MDYHTTVEMAEKWKITPRRIGVLCAEGRVKGAIKKGKTWLIPDDSEKPEDKRFRTTPASSISLVKIYTKEKTGLEIIQSNDLFFNLYTSNLRLGKEAKEAIMFIDEAKLTPLSHIETKYGIGTIRNLSSGCKTYLNILLNPDKIFNVAECGANVLELLFKRGGVNLFMPFPLNFDIPQKAKICFDDTDIVEGPQGFEAWWSKEYERRNNDL